MAEIDIQNTEAPSEISIINDGANDDGTQRTPEFSGYQAALFSSALSGSDKDRTEEQLNLGFEGYLSTQTRLRNETALSADLKRTIEITPLEDITLGNTSTEIQSIRESSIPEVDAVIYQNRIDDPYEKTDKISTHRLEVVKRLFQEQLDGSSQSFLAGAGYFLDALVSFPRDVATGGGFSRDSIANRIRNLVTRTDLSEQEFETEVRELISDASDTGFFTDDNWFYTNQLLENFDNYGGGLDKVFTVVDAVGLGTAAKSLIRGRDAVDLIAKGVSKEEAIGEVSRQVGRDTPSVETPRHTAITAATPTVPERTYLAGPGPESLRELELNNRTLDIVRSMDWGFFVQGDVFEKAKPAILKTMKDQYDLGSSKRYLDHDAVVVENGDFVLGRISFGKADGSPYKSFQKAQAYAREIGGEAEERLIGGEKRFVVVREVNIPTRGLADTTSEHEIATSLFQKISSPFITSSQRLDNILKRGEGQLGVVTREIAGEYRRVSGKVSSEDKDFIDQMYLELRDGVGSTRRKALTEEEFIDQYRTAFGRKPKPATIEFHRKVQELNDTTYFLNAQRYFREAVDRGEEILRTEEGLNLRVIPQKVNGVPANSSILDLDTGSIIPQNQLGKRSVYIVRGGYDASDGKKYGFVTTSSPRTRRLFHDDVMGYNVGGPRVYRDHKNFVKQESRIILDDGSTVSGRPITALATITQQEAKIAVRQINTILDKFEDLISIKGTSRSNAMQAIRRVTTNESLNKLIRENSSWSGVIEDADDFIKFLEDYNLDPTLRMSVAHDGELIRKATTNEAGEEIFAYIGGFDNGTETFADSFIKQSNLAGRKDRPLIGFGGEKPVTFNPIQAIERSFSRAINGRHEDAYMHNAINGWLKGAKPYITNQDEIAKMRPYQALKSAELGKAKEARAFDQERNIILRRAETQTGFGKWWENTVEDFAEWVYGKGAKKLGVSIKNQFSSDPTVALRSFAFDLKLGLFAFPQFFVQSTQVFNIIALSPVHGLAGFVSYTPVRMAIANGNESVIREIGKRAGPFIGLDADQFTDMIRWIRESGRDIVDNTVIEQSQDFNLAMGMVDKVRDLGRRFFYEGELVPRIAGLTTAYKEFIEKFPKVDPFSEQGISWITRRQDVLTAGMTRASSTAWQRDSLLSVPTQFLSYSSRMMEQLFLGNRILTPAERARLATIQLTMWGAGGYGMGSYINHLVNEGSLELSRDQYTALRYGLLDYIVGKTTGARTAFSERLSVGEGFADIFQKITEDKFFEVIFGPSGSIAQDVGGNTIKLLGDVFHGRFEIAQHDLWKTIRNLSSVNTAYNSWLIGRYGEYYSRNQNSLIANDLGVSEAIFNAMGAPLQDVSLTYDMIKLRRESKIRLFEHGTKLKEWMQLANNKLDAGDQEGAQNILKDIAADIAVLEPWERKEVISNMKSESMSLLEKTLIKMITEAKPNELGRMIARDKDNN